MIQPICIVNAIRSKYPGIRDDHGAFRKLQLGYLSTNFYVLENELLNGYDLVTITVRVNMGTQENIMEDATRREVYDRLMKLILDTMSE